MMKRWRWLAGVALVVLGGCDSDGEAGGEEAAQQAQEALMEPELHPVYGSWSADAYYEALQGTWDMGPERAKWTIEGRSLTSSDERIEGAQIEISSPGVLSVITEDGTTQMAIARMEGELYVGMGLGGSVLEDRFLFNIGPGIILGQDEKCTYYPYVHPGRTEEGLRPQGTEVNCDLTEDDGETYFSVSAGGQTIRPERQVLMGDTGMADRMLRGRKITPVED